MPESRLAERASFFAEVDILTHGEAMPQRYWGQNLSESGMFVQTTRPYAPGDRISLRFDIDAQEVHVRAAEVVWVKPFEPINVDGQMPGVGVRFLSIDPPARAAIRRHVNVLTVPQMSDVPAPPPEPELPEGDYVSLASLRPLSLPPFDSDPPGDAQMPPPVTLPPTTLRPAHAASPSEPPIGSPTLQPPPSAFGTGTDVPGHATTPPLGSPELPPPPVAAQVEAEPEPTTTPPRVSLPPDEPLPTPGVDTEHPLAGWSFQVEPGSLPPQPAEPAPAEPTPSVHPVATTQGADDDEEVRWSFSSSPPTAAAAPVESFDTLEDEEPVHTWPPERLGLSFDDEAPVTATTLPPPAHTLDGIDDRIDEVSCPPAAIPNRGEPAPSAAEQRKLDSAFFEGKLAVMELPQTEPRGARGSRPRRNRAAWALGLLVAGGALGAFLGYEPAEPPAPVALEEAAPLPEPKAVAVAEAGLFEPGAEAADAPVAKAAPKAAAAKATPKPVALTNAVKKPAPAPAAAPPAKAQPEAKAGVKAEYGRVTIPIEGGRVARAFGLADPPRVVIDLADATFPGHKKHDIGDKGIKEVRFGRPDPDHVRVVVELGGSRQPADITTLKRASSLAVAWK
jgi:uncharacterized protein (TIGR02266 family)